MEYRALVLSVAVALLASQVLAYPKDSEEVKEDRMIKPSSEGLPIILPSEDIVRSAPQEESKKPTPQDAKIKDDSIEKKKLVTEKEESKIVPNLKVRFPDDGSKQTMVKEDDDNIRAKKSPAMQEFSHNHGPHTTTVCIQVRSDHQSQQVVCGPQVNEGKKEMKPTAGARYAYPQDPSYYGRQAPFMRASPQELAPGRPSAASGKSPQQMIPAGQQMMPSGQPMMPGQQLPPKYKENPLPLSPIPGAARGSQMYPIRRSEEEAKPAEGNQQQQGYGQLPIRLIPQGPPPNSVVVHKQYYQAPIHQGYGPSPLRLNCAFQPDGQYIQPYGPSVLRSATPVLPAFNTPYGEQVITNQEAAARAAQEEEQAYYIDGQEEIVGSPYTPEYGYSSGEPWTGSTFMGEDGQTYIMEGSQGRSASEQEMWERGQYLRASGTSSSSSSSMDELRAKTLKQEQELKKSNQRLQLLQQQLKDIQERASVDELEKKDKKTTPHAEPPKEPKEPALEPASEPQETKKAEATAPVKTSKRQIRRQ